METTISLPKPHAGQRQVELSRARFVVLCCGRRWGKDVLLERRAVKRALKTRLPVGWFAPTYRMMTENYRALRNLLAPVIARASETEHRIDLITGNAVEFWSLDNPDAGRGRKYGHVAINEAAMVKGLVDAWTMVVRPTLADYRGSADFGSTPKGLNGFYELWRGAEIEPSWARFRFRTDDNPHIPADEIAAMRASLPERVIRQELDAEFVEDGSFFQGIDNACTIDAPDTPEQHAGHYVVGGLDWALSQDWTVLTLACRDCNRVVAWDRFNQIDYTYQRGRIIDACKRWGVQGLLPERNSIGEPNIELLIAADIPILSGPDDKPGFNTTATTKPALIQKLAGALEHDGLHAPRDYADELRSYEVETLSSGHPRFSAPDGMHDDRVISLALAWWAMTANSWLMVGKGY